MLPGPGTRARTLLSPALPIPGSPGVPRCPQPDTPHSAGISTLVAWPLLTEGTCTPER